jgi:hypothetical protein
MRSSPRVSSVPGEARARSSQEYHSQQAGARKSNSWAPALLLAAPTQSAQASERASASKPATQHAWRVQTVPRTCLNAQADPDACMLSWQDTWDTLRLQASCKGGLQTGTLLALAPFRESWVPPDERAPPGNKWAAYAHTLASTILRGCTRCRAGRVPRGLQQHRLRLHVRSSSRS